MGHLTKWFFFNLLCGAIPYALTVALNQLQHPGTPWLHPSSEVLFIAVVATSSALGELWDTGEENLLYRRSHGRALTQLVLLLGVLSTSVLYGAYVYATLSSPARVHGIDCSVLVGWTAGPGPKEPWPAELVARWAGVCGPWARTQSLFFHASLWLTALCVPASGAAMYMYPARRW